MYCISWDGFVRLIIPIPKKLLKLPGRGAKWNGFCTKTIKLRPAKLQK